VPKIKGKLISFEGIEGSGKSTQCKLLEEYLSFKGIEVLHLREPGGTAISEKIRTILLDLNSIGLKPLTEFLLFAASRAQVIEERILPALQEGTIVLCDRYKDSSVAYQGYGRGLGVELINRIHKIMGIVLNPDLTILLDLDAEIGLQRAKSNRAKASDKNDGGRIEEEEISFHKKVREGYLTLSRLEPERFRVISAIGNINEINKEIIKIVKTYLEI
jgi:dTMP kinase